MKLNFYNYKWSQCFVYFTQLLPYLVKYIYLLPLKVIKSTLFVIRQYQIINKREFFHFASKLWRVCQNLKIFTSIHSPDGKSSCLFGSTQSTTATHHLTCFHCLILFAVFSRLSVSRSSSFYLACIVSWVNIALCYQLSSVYLYHNSSNLMD